MPEIEVQVVVDDELLAALARARRVLKECYIDRALRKRHYEIDPLLEQMEQAEAELERQANRIWAAVASQTLHKVNPS